MEDPRPRQAIEQARAWVRGEITMSQARTAGGHAMAAARDLSGAARHAAYAAGQAAVVAHVAAHELGAAAYAIQAAHAAEPKEWARAQATRVPVAARSAPGGDSRARSRRPAVAERHLLAVFEC
ncbi:MAG: putative immunity protein [Propionibacteriaceae bacterium]